MSASGNPTNASANAVPGRGINNRRSIPTRTAAARSDTPSFRKTRRRRVFTVSVETNRVPAIATLGRPSDS